ncbi:MAG: peptidylprolyl isomerase [Candidatus Eremiobacteraeota bacterium]|nr:peptidylprolyl isomerase [Candidatus Eremiobacteraeota bacterium]
MPKLHRVIAAITTLALGASLVACSGGGTIATVNGQAISKSDFDAKLEGGQAAKSTLQQMVQEALLDQYAKTNNISVSDAEIAAKETEIKANFPNGSWADMLKSRGLTEADVSNLLRQQILVDKAVGKDIKIDDAQIKAYFDKNHAAFDKPDQARARHILVPDMATAQKVEAALKGGAKFEDLAKQYSTDPGSKDKGGELGFFRRGQMVKPFEAVAFTAPINAISAPVKSPFGYHIIQVEERQTGEKATLASAHDKIVDLLRAQQEQPQIQPFMTSLVTKANIVISDPRFDGLFPSPPPAAAPAVTTAATPAPASP